MKSPLPNRVDGAPKSSRERARECAAHGMAYLASALNACNNPTLTYRYSRSVLDRFEDLAAEIVDLVETGKIVELPHAAARNDREFQAFLEATLAPAKKRPKSRERAK